MSLVATWDPCFLSCPCGQREELIFMNNSFCIWRLLSNYPSIFSFSDQITSNLPTSPHMSNFLDLFFLFFLLRMSINPGCIFIALYDLSSLQHWAKDCINEAWHAHSIHATPWNRYNLAALEHMPGRSLFWARLLAHAQHCSKTATLRSFWGAAQAGMQHVTAVLPTAVYSQHRRALPFKIHLPLPDAASLRPHNLCKPSSSATEEHCSHLPNVCKRLSQHRIHWAVGSTVLTLRQSSSSKSLAFQFLQ